MQRQFWLLWRLAPAGTAYNIGALFELDGPFDAGAMAAAVHDLVARHPVLRTTFEERDGSLMACVHDALAPSVEVKSEPTSADSLASVIASPFDLTNGPLVRAALAPSTTGRTWLVLALHHIACDLRTKELLASDLAALYVHRRGGPVPPPPAGDYARVAAEDAAFASSEKGRAGAAYFAAHLDPMPAPLDLPYLAARGKTQPVAGARELLSIRGDLAADLRQRAADRHQKPFLFLLANWALLLARYGNVDRIAVGVPFTNRRSEARQDTVGCFVNDLPLAVSLVDAGGPLSFDALVAQIRAAMLGHHRHQETPMASMLTATKAPRDPSRNPIFQAGFTFEPPMALRLPGVAIESHKVHAGGTQMDVFMTLWETREGFDGQIEYASELFDRETIASMAQSFVEQLRAALADGSKAALELPWLSPAEHERVLRTFNQTDVAWPRPLPLPALFLEQAERTPGAIAVSMGERHWTYAELRARALAIATRLRQRGVAPGDLIGIFMQRSLELVASLYGVGLAGAAYVPIDPEYPAARIASMLDDARPRLVLGHADTRAAWPADRAPFVPIETLAEPSTEPMSPPSTGPADLPVLSPDGTAYVIFTSGSTGRPKGAANSHRGITNRILWMQDCYRLSADDVVLQKTPYGFDVSTWEFFWPLVTGARLEMAAPGIHRDPSLLARTIQAARVTTIHFVPSMLQAFLDHPEARRCTTLTRIIASGEALPAQLVRRCKDTLPAPLHNLYGPTEAAVDVTFWPCDRDLDRDPVPIGKPIANTRMYVLDRYRNPVPVGVPGELYIGGVQVGTGYVGRPDLTAERFVEDPWGAHPGARLYRTGDLGRWDPDGQLVYLGRLDHQVKIRGLRIELAEIESVLDAVPGVSRSVVVAYPPGDANGRIVAYVVPSAPGGVSADAIRARAAASLPAYMVPQQIVFLDGLPLSPNGKVDRKALPKPVDELRPAAPPEGEIESFLAGEWRRLLATDAVGRDVNVFEMGGSSVMIASLLGRVRERFGVDVPLVRFFEHPTIAQLAAFLDTVPGLRGGRTAPASDNPPDDALRDAHDRAMKRRAAQPRPRR